MDRFDFVVIGAGAAGESAAYAARERGKSVAVVERELFGGSCPFWACVPSKALLHSAAEHAHGIYPWIKASNRRDYMINREGRDWPDDSGHVRGLEGAGAKLFRGRARIAGPGVVEVAVSAADSAAGSQAPGSPAPAATRLQADNIIVATGSGPTHPEIEGLAETRPWTNREATSTRELPRSLVILGGGPVGVEMSLVFVRFGVKVTLVHSHDRLLDKDHPRNSEAAARILLENGVQIRLKSRAVRVRPGAGAAGAHVIDLSDGGSVEGERILHCLGRALNLADLGLESLGLDAAKMPHDGRLRVADNLFVIGDPAGPEAFTHVSHYQGEMAVRMALGERDAAPDYRAIPRAVFVEPELASVGVSIDEARAAGTDAFELVTDFATTSRGYGVEAEFGHVAIVVDRASRTLIGASIVAPDASAAIHEAVLAIYARTPIEVLAGMMHGFPTTPRAFGGLFSDALGELRAKSAVPA